MTGDERDELLASYLAGTLAPGDRDRLLRELRSDPRFARDAHDQWIVDRLLSLELDTRARRAFVEQVSEKIQASATTGSSSEMSEAELEMIAGGLGEVPPPPPPDPDLDAPPGDTTKRPD